MKTLFATLFLVAISTSAMAAERNPQLYRPFTVDGVVVAVPPTELYTTLHAGCSKLTTVDAIDCRGEVNSIASLWEQAVNLRGMAGLAGHIGVANNLNLANAQDIAKQAVSARLALQRKRPELFQ
jgi:hypothetical protein